MRRWLLFIIGFVTLLVVALPAAVIYYAAFTESGLQFIVSHVPERIGRVQIEIGKASGTLAGGVRLDRLDIEHERAHVVLEELDGRIKLAPLLWQTIRSPDFTVGHALVEVRRRTQPPPPNYTPRFLPRWLIVRADDARVGSATLVTPNGRRLEGTDISVSGVARHRTIRFFDAELNVNALSVAGTGELRADIPMQLEANGRLSWEIEGQPPWILTGAVDGDLSELPFDVQLTSPFRADATGQVADLTQGWHWAGRAQVHDFDIRTWGGGGVLGRITARLALRGDADGFRAKGTVTPAGLEAGAFDAMFEGSYADRVVTADAIELVHQSSGATASASGSIAVAPNGPRLDLRGSWRDFRWPLVGPEPAVRSAAGGYTLAGIWPYALRAGGVISVRDLDAMPVKLDGALDKGVLLIHMAEVEAFEGRASFGGQVSWSPERSWAVVGRAVGIDPTGLRPDLPGRLAFAFTGTGEGLDAQSDFSVEVRDLSGRLRGVAASGGGRLLRRGPEWQFERVRVALGRTNLALDGRLGEAVDVRFAVDAEDLSLLSPDSRGELRAAGTVQGTMAAPVVDASVYANAIQHGAFSVESLEATVDFNARLQQPSRIDVRGSHLSFNDRKIEQLSLELDGTANNHVVRVTATPVGMTLRARAAGSFAQGVWNGRLERLDANGTEALHLELEQPVGLLVSTDNVRAEWLCLRGKPARMCAEANWTPEAWSTTFTANDLPMRTLTSGLTPSVDYRGTLNVTARAFGTAQEPVQGSLRADLVDARIAHRLSSGRIEVITLGSGLVHVEADRATIQVDVGLDAGQIGTITGQLDIDRVPGRWQDMPVMGELHAHTAELGFVTLYVPQVDRASGNLESDLTLAGTLGTPLVDGVVKLTGAELDLYQINLALRDTSLEARLLDNGLDFEGSTRIGGGVASARGRLEWREALPYGKFALEGTDLRVVDIPEAQIDASPDLDFRIDGRKIQVTGAVRVPYAKIVPADLTGAVRASSDEIIVGEEPADPSKRFEVETGITLTLGERVSIDTSGLTGRLMGAITVRSGRDEVTRGSGELNIEEGKYTAYGRKLDIQRGRLILTGGPITNPGVDIRAVKQYPDVVAGVNVRGTLLQPRLTFFSEPSLPQSQIVSLILAGGGLASAQNGQSGGAGNELLAQGGAILAQQLGARVGIEDVSLESNLANETSIVLGKYLSPRLYVSYGISLTESLNTLKLRYSLDDHWTIKTEVGEARGADLVYTIEK